MYQMRVVGVPLYMHGGHAGPWEGIRTQRYPIGLGLSADCMSPIRVCAA